VARDADSTPTPPTPPAGADVDDLDDLNRRIADEAAAATTADKRNPSDKPAKS